MQIVPQVRQRHCDDARVQLSHERADADRRHRQPWRPWPGPDPGRTGAARPDPLQAERHRKVTRTRNEFGHRTILGQRYDGHMPSAIRAGAEKPRKSGRAAVDAWLLTDIVTRLRRVLRASIRSEYPWEALPMAQVEILQRLRDEPGLRVNDLAARHRLANNTVSVLVQQLVAADLITRTPDPVDRRAVRLQPHPTRPADAHRLAGSPRTAPRNGHGPARHRRPQRGARGTPCAVPACRPAQEQRGARHRRRPTGSPNTGMSSGSSRRSDEQRRDRQQRRRGRERRHERDGPDRRWASVPLLRWQHPSARDEKVTTPLANQAAPATRSTRRSCAMPTLTINAAMAAAASAVRSHARAVRGPARPYVTR